MSGLFDANRTDALDNAYVTINGGTNNTTIGNVTDRLKVDAAITSVSANATTPKNIIFEDGTLARDTQPALTVWTNVYSYTGAGKFYGCLVDLEAAGAGESDKWFINVVFDTTFKVFGTNGILCDDIINTAVYGLLTVPGDFAGLGFIGNVFRINLGDFPVSFSSKLEIQIKRITTLKKFKACLVKLTKD